MSEELRILLDEDEYDEHVTEMARRLTVRACLDNWLADFRRDGYDAVLDHSHGDFHEDYPLSVIEHAAADLGPYHTERSREETDPVRMAEMQAHKLVSKDAADRIADLQWELIAFDEATGEATGLTAEGERVVDDHDLRNG